MPLWIGLTIGKLSDRTNCHIETIRYYEKVGLLPKPPRSASDRRLYDETHVDRLKFIRRARALGFTLDGVRKLLKLSAGQEGTCSDVKELATKHLDEVRQKLSDLRAMERVLKNTLAQCSGKKRPDCPLIAALASDHVSRRTI